MLKTKNQISKLITDIKSGDRYALSKGLTLVESQLAKDQHDIIHLVEACWQTNSNCWRIGITGSPGVGKSSFIEQLGLLAIAKGKKVAVLSIDPSSLVSKGSILGDKTRMENLSKSEQAYIRPSANQGELGGIQKRSFESIILCEAAGYDVIFVETVGIGQAESEIRNIVDQITLLVLPGSGDELQGIKKGILELSDIIIMHKADGDRVNQAKISMKEYNVAAHITRSNNSPHVISASSVTNEGIEEYWSLCESFFNNDTSILRQKQYKALVEAYLKIMVEGYVLDKINFKATSVASNGDKSPIKYATEMFQALDLK